MTETTVESFEDYLRENVFTLGSYTYEAGPLKSDVRVAEFDGGSGYVCPNDLERAIEDENVGVRHVDDGWLGLTDER